MTSARAWREAWRRASPLAQLAACLAAAVFLSQTLLIALSNGLDFVCFHDAAAAVAHGAGAHVYDGFFAYRPGTRIQRLFFIYPPPVALLYAPLGLLPFGWALSLYQAASLLALALCASLAGRRAPAGRGLLAAALILLYLPAYYSIQLGQSDVWALACLMGALALEGAPLGDAAAGTLLAVAASLKLFLLLGAAALLLARRRGLLAWAAAAFAALWAAGLLAVPWDVQRLYLLRLRAPLGVEPFIDNLSLNGLLLRLLTRTPYAVGLADAPGLAAALHAALSAALVGGLCWLLRRRPRASLSAATGFAICTALLVSPVADTHHLTLLLPGLLSLLLAGERPPWPALALYAVFAMTQPPVAYKFLDRARLDLWLAAPLNAALPLGFWALLGLWAYWARLFRRGAPVLEPFPPAA